MAGLGNLTTTLITTRGLFTLGDVTKPGFTALTFGAGITPWFRLYLGEDFVPPVQGIGATGSRIYQPGEFANSLKYIDPATGKATSEPPWLVVPRDREHEYFNKGKIVTIRLVWQNKEYERTYPVSEGQAKRIVEIVNFINASRERIKITVSDVKKITTTALVEVRNLILRRKPNK